MGTFEVCETYIKNKDDKLIKISNEDNRKILFPLLKNNEITMLETYCYVDNDYYNELCELLKTNTSVNTLRILCNNGDNQFFKSLHDMLVINNSINMLHLSDTKISIENCEWICQIIKKNTSVEKLYLNYEKPENNTCENIINALKFNNTLKLVYIGFNNSNVVNGELIAELLTINKTLNYITLSIPTMIGITNSGKIADALEYNSSVITLNGHYLLGTNTNINNYCERNRHNIMLRSLTIQDLF
jgi:hypothetical protein